MHPVQRKWTETANYWNFSKSKGHNSVKNGSIIPKIELDLDILTINPCIKFHYNMCIQCEDNERKLLMDRPTDWQTAAKQYALPSSKEGIINIKTNTLQNKIVDSNWKIMSEANHVFFMFLRNFNQVQLYVFVIFFLKKLK